MYYIKRGTGTSNNSPSIQDQSGSKTQRSSLMRPLNTLQWIVAQNASLSQLDKKKLSEVNFAEKQQKMIKEIISRNSTANTTARQSMHNIKIKALLQSPKGASNVQRHYSPRLTKIMNPSLERIKLRERHNFRIEQSQKVIIQEIGDIQHQFLQMIHNVNREEAVEGLLQLLVISVNQDDITMLIDAYKLMSFAYISLGHWAKALMFLDQTRTVCNLTRRFHDKIWALNQLAVVAKKLHRFHEAAIFVKKGLQYAWLQGNQEQELSSYDQLGILSYLEYNVEQGKILHSKAVDGTFEPHDSVLKSISKRDLDKFIGSLPEPTKNINSLLMSKSFNFPFKMIPNLDKDYYANNSVKNSYLIAENLVCVTSGRMTDYPLVVLDCLAEVLAQEEFKFEFPTPIAINFQTNLEFQIQSKEKALKQLSQVETKFSRERTCHIPNQNSVTQLQTYYLEKPFRKVALHELIEERVEKKYDTEQILRRIYKSNYAISQRNDPLKLTHLTSNRNLGNYEFNKRDIVVFSGKIFRKLIQQLTYQN